MTLPYPVKAVVLGLDTSKASSGSTLLIPTGDFRTPFAIEHACVVKTQKLRESCVRHAADRSKELGLPLLISAEEWTPGGRWGFKQVIGMGEGWGKWTAEFERAEIEDWQVIRTVPNVWRIALYGSGYPNDTEKLKQKAVSYVNNLFRIVVQHDVAEAACVGIFGAQLDAAEKIVNKWIKRQKKLTNVHR